MDWMTVAFIDRKRTIGDGGRHFHFGSGSWLRFRLRCQFQAGRRYDLRCNRRFAHGAYEKRGFGGNEPNGTEYAQQRQPTTEDDEQ